MYERILLPTDGSEGVDRAFEQAVGLASTYDAELHVLYVVESDVYSPDLELATLYDRLEGHGEEVLDEATARARAAGVEAVEGHVVEGQPHRAILDYADDNDVDLVVMGTHGRTGLDRYLLGSVTEKVVRSAGVPVLTVRMRQEGPDGADEAADAPGGRG